MTIARLARLAAIATLVAAPTRAGILDSPPPSLGNAGPGIVVYRIAPVYFEPGRVDTVVSCHNATAGAVSTALEVFGDDDQPRGTVTRASAPAGGDVLFATSTASGLEHTTPVPGLPALPSGKARLSATSSDIACSATHRIRSPDGALKELPVELVKKVASGAR